MTQWLYLGALIISIVGIAVLDWRYQLAFWYDKRRAVITVAIGMAIFTLWDILGIQQGIFRHGDSNYALALTVLPEFPLEELFFLLLLCYCTLTIYRAGVKLWPRT